MGSPLSQSVLILEAVAKRGVLSHQPGVYEGDLCETITFAATWMILEIIKLNEIQPKINI